MKVRVQVDGQTYEVEIGDLSGRPIQVVVDGELFAVWPEEVAGVVDAAPVAEEAKIETLSARNTEAAPRSEAQEDVITAPLPGDIIVIAVRLGDKVETGQLLCTVESMKMNNPVRATRAGTVDEIFVAVGDHVNYGQPMLRLR